jgi:hypothetical protein
MLGKSKVENLPPLHDSILDFPGFFISKGVLFRDRIFLALLFSIGRVIVDLNVVRDILGGFVSGHDGLFWREVNMTGVQMR